MEIVAKLGDIVKEIKINLNNFDINEVKDIKYKARAIIINNDNLLLTVNGGTYLLPGGSINEKEAYIDAVKREVLEETGILMDEQSLIPVTSYEEYVEKFPKRDGVTFVSRYTKTLYFYYEKKAVVNENEMCLSDLEKNNFSYEWVNINKLEEFLIDNYDNDNLKRPFFDRELLTAIDEYKTFKKEYVKKKKL